HPGLLRTPDERFTEQPEAVPDPVPVRIPCLLQVFRHPPGLDLQEILPDGLIRAFPEHVPVMGIWIHLLEFGRDDPAGPKYDDMVPGRVEHLGDDHPDQLVARAPAVWLPDRTGDEDPDLPGFHFIFIDD